MLRFLYLFAAYREALEGRAAAESALRVERSRASEAIVRAERAEAELVHAYKTQAESLQARFLGHRTTPSEPVAGRPELQRRYRETGRSAAARQTAKAQQDVAEYIEEQRKQA